MVTKSWALAAAFALALSSASAEPNRPRIYYPRQVGREVVNDSEPEITSAPVPESRGLLDELLEGSSEDDVEDGENAETTTRGGIKIGPDGLVVPGLVGENDNSGPATNVTETATQPPPASSDESTTRGSTKTTTTSKASEVSSKPSSKQSESSKDGILDPILDPILPKSTTTSTSAATSASIIRPPPSNKEPPKEPSSNGSPTKDASSTQEPILDPIISLDPIVPPKTTTSAPPSVTSSSGSSESSKPPLIPTDILPIPPSTTASSTVIDDSSSIISIPGGERSSTTVSDSPEEPEPTPEEPEPTPTTATTQTSAPPPPPPPPSSTSGASSTTQPPPPPPEQTPSSTQSPPPPSSSDSESLPSDPPSEAPSDASSSVSTSPSEGIEPPVTPSSVVTPPPPEPTTAGESTVVDSSSSSSDKAPMETETEPSWLPTSIVADPTTFTFVPPTTTDETPTQTDLPDDMPGVIGNPNKQIPDGSVLLQIGFEYPLNYKHVSKHPMAVTQIFRYLPKALSYAGGFKIDKVQVKELTPEDTRQKWGYVTTIAKFYYPENLVDTLVMDIWSPNSDLYNHPNPLVRDLTEDINPRIDIWGNIKDDGDDTKPKKSDSDDNGSLDSDDEGSSKSAGTTAGIAVGALGLSVMYGAAMFIVARRYKRKRQSHRRASSLSGSEASSEMRYGSNGSPAMMGGALASQEMFHYGAAGGRERDSHGSGNNSARTANISAPVATENSLGWN